MIQKIREGMTGKRVADVIQDNFEYILYEIGYYKEYDPKHFSGMGHIILDLKDLSKNTNCCCGCNCRCYGVAKTNISNILEQTDFPQHHTIYEIKYDFDLNGGTIQIPQHCILYFNGGTISNGTIDLNGAKILPNGWSLGDYFKDVTLNNFHDGQQIYKDGKLYIYVNKEGSNTTVVIDANGNVTIEGDNEFIQPGGGSGSGDVTQDEFDKLEQSVDTVKDTVANHTTQIQQLTSRVSTLESKVSQLESKVSSLESQIGSINTIREELNTIKNTYYRVATNNGIEITQPQIWTGSDTQYNAITEKQDNTVYMIKE